MNEMRQDKKTFTTLFRMAFHSVTENCHGAVVLPSSPVLRGTGELGCKQLPTARCPATDDIDSSEGNDWGDKTTQGRESTESNDLKFMIPKMYPYKIL